MKILTTALLVAGLMTLPACSSHRHHGDAATVGVLGGAVIGAVAGGLLVGAFDDDRHTYVHEKEYVVVEKPAHKRGWGSRRHHERSRWRDERYSYREHSWRD